MGDSPGPTDLIDEVWDRIASPLPKPAKREVVNVIRYMTRPGGGWRMLPKDSPPW